MLDKLFGNQTMAMTLLNLYHYGQIHSRAIARNIKQYPSAVGEQLNKLEEAGLVVSQQFGRSRLYQFNPKNPMTKPLKELIAITYDAIPSKMKQEMFLERERPRSKGKAVIKG